MTDKVKKPLSPAQLAQLARARELSAAKAAAKRGEAPAVAAPVAVKRIPAPKKASPLKGKKVASPFPTAVESKKAKPVDKGGRPRVEADPLEVISFRGTKKQKETLRVIGSAKLRKWLDGQAAK